MAGLCCARLPVSPALFTGTRNRRSFRCSARKDAVETPPLLKLVVNGATELLRIFRFGTERSGNVDYKLDDDASANSVDDILIVLRSDYARSYFVTGNFTSAIYSEDCLFEDPTITFRGNFTSAIYSEDCLFEDPTITFRGRDLYARNLKLLVPFLERPLLALQKIEKGYDGETEFVMATWTLRTYLRLPWRPLISIEGTTSYDLDQDFRIVRHIERWNVSAIEAIGQIFTPGLRNMADDESKHSANTP